MKSRVANKWDIRFLQLAAVVSTWSKDPSTQVGSVIVDERKRIISLGFNGFPQSLNDDSRLHNRELKYPRIIHGEMNALLFAQRSIEGATLYVWPICPCPDCLKHFIQKGIRAVVFPSTDANADSYKRWEQNILISKDMMKESNIQWREISSKYIL